MKRSIQGQFEFAELLTDEKIFGLDDYKVREAKKKAALEMALEEEQLKAAESVTFDPKGVR